MSSVSGSSPIQRNPPLFSSHSVSLEERLGKLFSVDLTLPTKEQSRNLVRRIGIIKSLDESLLFLTDKGFRLDRYVVTELLKKDAPVDDHVKFFNLIPDDFLCVEHYNNLIFYLGKTGYFRLAKLVFESALRNRMIDSTTWAHFIYAAGECREFSHVQKAFERAHAAKLANERVFNYYFLSCGKNQQIQAILKAFDELKSGGATVSIISYNRVIDALVENGEIEQANRFFEESGIELKTFFSSDGEFCIDFHGSSYGMAILALERFKNMMPISFITGIGKHGINDHFNYRNKIIEYIERHYSAILDVAVNPNNQGCLRITEKKAEEQNEGFIAYVDVNKKKFVKFTSLSLRVAARFIDMNIQRTPFAIIIPEDLCKDRAAEVYHRTIVHYICKYYGNSCYIPSGKTGLGYIPIYPKRKKLGEDDRSTFSGALGC